MCSSDLAGRQFAPESIEKVEVGMYEVGYTGHEHRHCENLLDAQMSAPVAAALTLRFGDINTTSFQPETLAREDVKALIERVHPYVDEECERIYPGRRSGAVAIHLRDGTTLRTRVLDPRGEGGNPLTDGDLERKFRSNCEPILGAARCDRLVESVWRFEELDSLTEFFRWG